MKKILIADDHSIVREGIIKTLSAKFPDAEFGEAGAASEALQCFHAGNWDLVILDVNLPGRSGMDVLKEICKLPGHPNVIILSMYPEDQFAVRVIRAGASAYLTKSASMHEIVDAVETVLQGKPYITPSVGLLLAREISDTTGQPVHEILSDREYQVFRFIAAGKTISGIARDLSLSVKTISVYRAHILQKMNLKNNAEITHYAFKHHLVE